MWNKCASRKSHLFTSYKIVFNKVISPIFNKIHWTIIKTSLFSSLLDNAAILSINQPKLLTCTQPHAPVTILQKVPKFTILTRNVNLWCNKKIHNIKTLILNRKHPNLIKLLKDVMLKDVRQRYAVELDSMHSMATYLKEMLRVNLNKLKCLCSSGTEAAKLLDKRTKMFLCH